MRTLGVWLGMVLLLITGCRSTRPNLEPEPEPPNFQLPPASDRRFSEPQELARDNKNGLRPRLADPTLTPGMTRSPRAGMGQGNMMNN